MGLDEGDCRGHEEWFRPHINQTVDGAWGVVGVDGGENQMPGQGGSDGNLCSLRISNFSHHDDIGRLTEEGSQGPGKGETNFFIHLNLIDPFHVVLDGILYSEDVDIRGIETGEGRIEGSGLSTSRGSCHQEDSVGIFQSCVKATQGGLFKTKFIHVDH